MYVAPHIAGIDMTTQSISVANTPQLVTFDTISMAHKIVATSSTRFTFNERGFYIVNISPLIKSAAAGKILDIWLRVNGVDVANSNTKTKISNSNDEKRPAIIFPTLVTAGQYIEVWMSGNSTGLSLLSAAAGTSPTRPSTSSCYLSIFRAHDD